MLSRAQQILIKRAQREAGLDDADYRDALALVSGLRSTTDGRMTDRHVDLVLAYMEAIYWRGVDAGALQPPRKRDAVFRQRGYWAAKNASGNTSRDRFAAVNANADADALEAALGELGFGPAYCAAIREKVSAGRNDAHALYLYKCALQRTLRAKQKVCL